MGTWKKLGYHYQVQIDPGSYRDIACSLIKLLDISNMQKQTGPNLLVQLQVSVEVRLGSSNRIMRSGVHRACFELLGNATIVIGITIPMDYYSNSLYTDLDSVYPRDSGITGKYPHVVHGENKINVVTLVVSKYNYNGHVMLYMGQCGYDFGSVMGRFYPVDIVGFVLDMDNGTMNIYKNGNCDGKVISGLGGEYVWFVIGFNDGVVMICEWE